MEDGESKICSLGYMLDAGRTNLPGPVGRLADWRLRRAEGAVPV